MVPIVSPSEVLLTRRLACSPPAPILLAWSCAVHSVSSSLGERGGGIRSPSPRGKRGDLLLLLVRGYWLVLRGAIVVPAFSGV